MLHVDMNLLACSGQKYAPMKFILFAVTIKFCD